jgi:hypothetical protein
MEFRGRFLKTPNSKLGTEGGLMNKGLRRTGIAVIDRIEKFILRNLDLIKKGQPARLRESEEGGVKRG